MLELIDHAFESQDKRSLVHRELTAANHNRLVDFMKMVEPNIVKTDNHMSTVGEGHYKRSRESELSLRYLPRVVVERQDRALIYGQGGR